MTQKRSAFIFFSLTSIFLLMLVWNFRWYPEEGKEGLNYVIKSDGKGYYSYLPDIFINKDFGKGKTKRNYEVETEDGKFVNKYTYGTALLELPFFAVASVYAGITGTTEDGYSEPFQFAVTFAGLFYFLAGLYFLARIIICLFPSIKNHFLLLALFTGASFSLYYAVILPSFSHIYSFFLINLFFFLLIKWKEKFSVRLLFYLSLVAGIIFITRPVNILVVLFIPFFFKNGIELITVVKERLLSFKSISIIAVSFVSPLLVQMFLWHYQAGQWFYWSYKGEGFYFSNPQMVNYLFGFKKGFFIYSPLYLLLFPAWILYLKMNKWRFFISFGFFIVVTYIFSSWYNWFYADSFGMRPMVDITGVLLIICAALFVTQVKWKKTFLYLFTLICLFLNIIFCWQFYQGIIHSNTMDAKKFAMIFLKTGPAYYNYFGGAENSPPYAPNGMRRIESIEENFEAEENGYKNCDELEFPYTLRLDVNERLSGPDLLLVEINFKHQVYEPHEGNNLLFVIHSTLDDSTSLYYAVRAKEFPVEEPGQWVNDKLVFYLDNEVETGEQLSLYFWNKEKENISLDDVKIIISTPE